MDKIAPAVVLSALSAIPSAIVATAGIVASLAGAAYALAVTVLGYALTAAGAMITLAVYPVSLAWRVLFLVLSPVIYTVAYALAPVWFLVGLAPKLQPLYIYFGSAAFVGIITGVVVKIISDLSVSVLRLDKEEPAADSASQLARRGSTASTATSSAAAQPQVAPPSASAAIAGKKRGEREDDYFASLGLPEIDWQVIDRIESRGPHSEHMRRMPLLQSIILEEEEDDSSNGGY
ncbi:hypothetical protein RB594_009096 [Gaeumannomyces avenae]